MKLRTALPLGILALIFCATLAPAVARTQSVDHGGTYFGSVVIDRNQDVQGDVTVIGGDADVRGEIDGDLTVVGGTLYREPGSTITGKVTNYGGQIDSLVPLFPAAAASHTIGRENAKLMTLLAYSVLVVLVFLIFPVRVRIALDRVEEHPGLSAAVGVFALIASVPLAVLLFISFVGWPLLPVELVAYIAGVLIGQAALSLLIGRRLYELVHPHATPSPLGALILGLVILCAAEILPVVGWLVIALVWIMGLGAAILAFIRETTFTAGGTPARPPIEGPPMRPA